MGKQASAAQAKAVADIRTFLLGTQPSDFTDVQDFADALYQVVETAFKTHFETNAANAIKSATKASYSFFRLKDETAFGESGSPITLSFGAPDRRSIRFFDSVDQWYFSKFMRNDDAAKPLRKFLREEYLEKGAALFGRETPESLDDFRQAAGEKLQNLTDFQIKRIVSNSVARIRNWAHIGSMHQAAFELARYVAVLDARTTEICRHIDGKMIRVGTAQQRITELTQLEPGEFAYEMYENSAAREYQKNPVAWIEQRTTKNVVDDSALRQNIGLPPLHILCRTRLEGVFEELEGGDIAPTPAPEPAPEPEKPELSAAEARKQLAAIEASYRQQRKQLANDLAAKARRAAEVTGPRAQVLIDEVTRLRSEYEQLDGRQLKEMRRLLEVKEPVAFDLEFAKGVGAQVKAVVQEGVAQFQRLVSSDFIKDLKLTVHQTKGRAFQRGQEIHISPKNDVGTVVHEIGHWLEQHAPDILKKIVDFHEQRTKGDAEERLDKLFPGHGYKPAETTRKDNYLHAYMGKTYRNVLGKVLATEQVSMGLEWFVRDPLKLVQHDPEMFDLIYEVARLKKKQ